MIEEIHLNSFGKFKNKIFSLSPVSFFFGKNESGKSTIFDAILYALTKPKGNHAEGMRIHGRYGKELDVTLKGDIPEKLDTEEFLNLHSLKASEIGMDFSKGKWVDNLKKQLFSGGIDPISIADGLEKHTSTRGSTTHIKERKKKETELDELELEIQSIQAKKNELLRKIETVKETEGKRIALQKQISEEKRKLEETKESIRFQESIREKKKLTSLYKYIVDFKHFTEVTKNLSEFRPENLSAINHLEKQFSELQGSLTGIKESLEMLDSNIQNQENRILNLERDFQTKSSLENLARSLKERIESHLQNIPTKIHILWKKPFILASVILSMIGIGLVVLGYEDKSLEFILGLILLGISPVIVLLGREKREIQNHEKIQEILIQYKREWEDSQKTHSQASATDTPGWNTLQDMRDFLFQFINKRANEFQNLLNDKETLQNLKFERESMEKNLSFRNKSADELKKKMQEWFATYEIKSKEDYIKKMRELSSAIQMKDSLLTNIQSYYPDGNVEDILVDTQRRLSVLDELGVPNSGMDDSEFQRIKHNLNHIESELNSLQMEERNLEVSTAIDRAGVEAQLIPLSEKLLNSQIRVMELKEEIESLERTRLANLEAKKIFEILGEESGDILVALSEEIAVSSSKIFDRPRKIQINNLNNDIFLEDENGELRSLEHLSLGTKDSFYIAAKLALCEKRDPDLKLFLMDEPFIALDNQRETEALKVLKHYVEDKNWQILIFSKEEKLKNGLDVSFDGKYAMIEI